MGQAYMVVVPAQVMQLAGRQQRSQGCSTLAAGASRREVLRGATWLRSTWQQLLVAHL